jgi:hypothetical protein
MISLQGVLGLAQTHRVHSKHLNITLFICHYLQFNLLIIVFTDTSIFMFIHFKTFTRVFTKIKFSHLAPYMKTYAKLFCEI